MGICWNVIQESRAGGHLPDQGFEMSSLDREGMFEGNIRRIGPLYISRMGGRVPKNRRG
jgi:hypothetical protein